MMNNEFWAFSKNHTTAGDPDKSLLGGKGAGLVEMSRMGFPVPPGFIIPTTFCSKPELLPVLAESAAYQTKEFIAGELNYEKGTYPLVSVRSGARVSMPGMMDTILNVGITQSTMDFWVNKLGQRGALDCYRRLIQMYGHTVKGVDDKLFAAAMKEVMTSKYGMKELPTAENKLPIPHLMKLVDKYLVVYNKATGEAFPQTLEAQLEGAISAVFKSWNSERAISYRKQHKIPDDWYTAVTIQAMVFGNAGDKSCSGVLFSRNFNTGEKESWIDWLPNAQGEEVVSGTADPLHATDLFKWNAGVFHELNQIMVKLEHQYKDMVDVEFTVENGTLCILQSRVGKRTAYAAFKIAYDMAHEGLITKAMALKRVTGAQYTEIRKPTIDPKFTTAPMGQGLQGSNGLVTGKIWLTSAKAQKNPGGILVSKETTPDHFSGMAASAGILTKTGGLTSHAAVVARSMNKAAVVGCTDLVIDSKGITLGQYTVIEGDEITLDGSTGKVYFGKVPTIGGKVLPFINEMIEWGSSPTVALKYDAARDVIPESGEVFISLVNLITVEQTTEFMDDLMKKSQLRGILSLSEEPDDLFDDSKFLTKLGLGTQIKRVSAGVQSTVCGYDCSNDAKRWTLVGVVDSFNTNFFKVHKKAMNLKDLLNCDGYFEASPELLSMLSTQGVTVEDFAQALKGSGKSLNHITKPKNISQVAFQVFGV